MGNLLPEYCMKINAKFRLPLIAARQANYRSTKKYLLGRMDENLFIALIFTLETIRRAGGFHLLCYSGRSIDHYRFALKCLAYESLQLVQNSGIRPGSQMIFCLHIVGFLCMNAPLLNAKRDLRFSGLKTIRQQSASVF